MKINIRDKGTQVKPDVQDKSTQTGVEPIDLSQLAQASPSSNVEDTQSSEDIEEGRKLKVLSHTFHYMKKAPEEYLGLSREKLKLIEMIHNKCKCSKLAILLTLRKMKLDEQLFNLAHTFNMRESEIVGILKYAIPKIGAYLKKYIYWPKKEVIRKNLPESFKDKYSNVESIIGCFELGIEEPSTPDFQSLTWSSYKNEHTLKYLISITPDGFINFISKAYGGAADDTEIVDGSDYLDNLRPNVGVMVHRGCENLDDILAERNCTLIKPASSTDGRKLTDAQKIEAKMIRRLTIQIDKVMKRLRDYRFIYPAGILDNEFMDYIDSGFLIVGALMNIKKIPL